MLRLRYLDYCRSLVQTAGRRLPVDKQSRTLLLQYVCLSASAMQSAAAAWRTLVPDNTALTCSMLDCTRRLAWKFALIQY